MPSRIQVNTDSVQTVTNKVLSGCNLTATGGTTAVTLANFAAREVWVEDFGAVGDGVTNDATAIQNAINAMGAADGGIVNFDSKVYAITATLTNTFDNVLLNGQGAGYSSSAAAGLDYATASTTLLWTGAAGGTMYNFGPTVGGADKLHGGGIVGIFFEGSSSAATGVLIRSVNSATFDLTIEDCTTVGFDMNVESTVVSTQYNSQSNNFTRIVVIHQSATSGICVRLDGAVGGNTSLNHFGTLTLLHRDGVALKLLSCDGNWFDFVRIFRHPSGTAIGIELLGSTVDATKCRDNHFGFVQTDSGGLTSRANTFSAVKNSVRVYSTENGSPVPTVEYGSSFSWWNITGQHHVLASTVQVEQQLRRHIKTADSIAVLGFHAYNADEATIEYARITGISSTVTAGVEDGTIRFSTMNAGTQTVQGQFRDGLILPATPTGTYRGVGTINISADYYKNGSAITGIETVTYSTSMTPDVRNGTVHIITATDGVAFAINATANRVTSSIITIMISNTSGGALGVASFNADYKMGAAWTQPATGFNRSIQFVYNGTDSIEMFRSAADVAN
jgi:hypothetical protein